MLEDMKEWQRVQGDSAHESWHGKNAGEQGGSLGNHG